MTEAIQRPVGHSADGGAVLDGVPAEREVVRPARSRVARHQRVATRQVPWLARYLRAAVLLDLFAGVLGVVTTVSLAKAHEGLGLQPGEVVVVVFAPIAWVLAIAHARGYERRLLGVGTEEYGAYPRAAVRMIAVTAVVTFAAYEHVSHLSRFFVLVFFPVALVVSLLLRYMLRQRLHHARIRRGNAMQHAVVLGCQEAAAALIEDLRRDPSSGLRPDAACTSTVGAPIPGVARHAPIEDALQVVDEVRADVVVIAHPSDLSPTQLRRLSWELEERDVELMVSPGLMEVAGPRLSIRPSGTLSLVHVESPYAEGGVLGGKILFDRIMSVLLTLVAMPLLLLAALAIKLDSRGPVLFRQTRVGAGGQTFRIFKFRTMVQDAEALLPDVRDEADHGNGVLFKRRDDPRVTRVGKLLRRYSVDELPQLFNVVLGHMSLVGPRPPLQTEVEQYEPDAIRRLRVRPGLTGLWQVSGRSNLSWDESLRLDLRYVDNWSMMLDLQILWRTARAVLRGEGAY